MKATLVAFYGNKPEELADYLNKLQRILLDKLRDSFISYDLQQIHATIVGIEGVLAKNMIINKNFQELRHKYLPMNLAGFFEYIKTIDIFPIPIQIGGFTKDVEYNFFSQGKHPFYRSFNIQTDLPIIIGWPFQNEVKDSLSHLRKEVEQFNILHKYHQNLQDKDNDLYFVLGKIKGNFINKNRINYIEQNIKHALATTKPFQFELNRDDLSLVFYNDSSLSLNTSLSIKITSDEFNYHDLYRYYRDFELLHVN